MSALAAFINRHSRVRCVSCGRTLLRGERGHAAIPAKHANERPHSPVWCQGCLPRPVESEEMDEG